MQYPENELQPDPALGVIELVPGTCPRCGRAVPKNKTGRPPKWCSQQCRRAAYEERRAAARGALAVQVVAQVTEVEHDIGDCIGKVLGSEYAMLLILDHWNWCAQNELLRPFWRRLVEPLGDLARRLEKRREDEVWALTASYRSTYGRNPPQIERGPRSF